MAETQTSINIPQLIAVALVGFLALRWFLNKPSSTTSSTSSTSSSSSSSSRDSRQQVDISKIDQISSMFPQLDRRQIAWDLHRNGGSVAATTERVLGGRGGLDNAPISFQPNLQSPAAATTSSSATGHQASRSSGGGGAAADKRNGAPSHPDLITRYGLQARISGKGKEAVLSEEQKRNAWSADKGVRAEGLKKRREEMVLAARRRMEEKDGQA